LEIKILKLINNKIFLKSYLTNKLLVRYKNKRWAKQIKNKTFISKKVLTNNNQNRKVMINIRS
jgi:hypothetical protein